MQKSILKYRKQLAISWGIGFLLIFVLMVLSFGFFYSFEYAVTRNWFLLNFLPISLTILSFFVWTNRLGEAEHPKKFKWLRLAAIIYLLAGIAVLYSRNFPNVAFCESMREIDDSLICAEKIFSYSIYFLALPQILIIFSAIRLYFFTGSKENTYFSRPKNFRKLRQLLSALYIEKASQQRVASDAQLDAAKINFSDIPENSWDAILKEALKRDKLKGLMNIVLEEYPENEQLKQWLDEFQEP